jgi:hypothetical protein
VPKHEAVVAEYVRSVHARSDMPAPYLRFDGMKAFKSPINGLWFDSKSAWERHVKANGCEIIGNDLPRKAEPCAVAAKKDLQADIAKAFQMHEQGYQAAPVRDASEVGIDARAAATSDFVRGEAVTFNAAPKPTRTSRRRRAK